MPRKLRLQYPGAMYHVMSRGNRRGEIFLDDVDRQDFLKTLAEACQKTGWQVHAYCLMANHYHLVVETPEPNLVAGMAWLQSTYTIRLNHRHQLFGHVVSGRYQSQLVEGSGNGYLRTACDYGHLNPVRANLLRAGERLLAYPWSSFRAYLAAPQHRPAWVRVDRLLGEHGIQSDRAAGREQLEQWMERRRQEEETDPEAQKVLRRGWKEAGLKRRRKNDPDKLEIGARLRRETTLTIKAIAARVGLGTSKGANVNLHRHLQGGVQRAKGKIRFGRKRK